MADDNKPIYLCIHRGSKDALYIRLRPADLERYKRYLEITGRSLIRLQSTSPRKNSDA